MNITIKSIFRVFAIMSILLLFITPVFAQEKARTESGKQILVYPNGTWSPFVEQQFKNGEQDSWSYCGKCYGLWYSGGHGKGSCPSGGSHIKDGSYNYILFYHPNNNIKGQNQWRHCSKCLGLWYGGWPNKNGVCPAGGAHTSEGSHDYIIPNIENGFQKNARFQSEWRFCIKCLGMWYGGNGVSAVCPAGGQHNSQGSYNYVLWY